MNQMEKQLVEFLEKFVEELDDAAGFMDTFSEYPDESYGEEGYERVQKKYDLIEKAQKVIAGLNK